MIFNTAIFFIALHLSLVNVRGELIIENATPLSLVYNIAPDLVDMGIIDENSITLIGHENCAALFANGIATVGGLSDFPDSGIALASGSPHSLKNSDSGMESTCHGTPGDSYLSDLTGSYTQDACVLEFQFLTPPDVDKLYMNYILGSDEYTEYVGSEFNDAFALVLNGDNLAVIPGSESYVSINTVNDVENSEYYNGNEDGQFPLFEPDGFTTMLTAEGDLIAGELNTISFRVADAADCAYDTWVLIQELSFGFVERTEAPSGSPAGAYGDPHINTWGGESYDFHGACDLVLFSNPSFDNGSGVDVHIRNKRMNMWSFIETTAIRIGNDIFELTGGKDNDNFLINGIVQKVKNENGVVGSISGYDIKFMQVNEKSRKFIINLGTNQNKNNLEEIVFKTWNSFVSVSVKNPTMNHFDGSLGLMGSFPAGAMVARDGKTMFDDSDEFGQEWQVLNSEPQLFSQRGTVGPNDMCSSPSKVEMRRRLQGSIVTLKEAEIACDSVSKEMNDLCIFDVMATNDKSSSGAY